MPSEPSCSGCCGKRCRVQTQSRVDVRAPGGSMTTFKQVLIGVVVAAAAVTVTPSISAAAQRRGRVEQAPGAVVEDGVSPAEIQRLFDAYVIMQAQQQLQLTDDQFAPFLARVKTLQEVRRRGQMQRGRILQELRRLSQAGGQDEALRAQLKAL